MSSKLTSCPSKAELWSDADLFLLLQSGKTDLLGVLFDRHAALVYGICLKLLGNMAEAEDLTQDIFLTLTKKCSYNPKQGTLRTYLITLTRSHALERLRAPVDRIKPQPKSDNENVNLVFDIFLDKTNQLERSQLIRLALEQLSAKERKVLEMSYYQGMNQLEIAKQLNIDLVTVTSCSRRGLLKLYRALIDLQENS